MNNHPPEPTAIGRNLAGVIDAVARLRLSTVWIAIGAGFVLTIAADVATGVRVTMFLPYLLVATFAAWCLGERTGFAVGIATTLVSTIIKHVQLDQIGHPMTIGTEAWNALARTLSTAMLVAIAGSLRDMIVLERWRASTDGLTGVLNKMAFGERLAAHTATAAAEGRTLVLCYMDLDGFKQVNDTHGHGAGDMVLRRFAEGAAAAMRAEDLFARIGGDEFVALLVVDDAEEGEKVARMIHARLSDVLADTGQQVTCSMGALVRPARSAATIADYLYLADQLMYEVKRSGKNGLRVRHLAGAAAAGGPHPVAEPRLDRLASGCVA